MLLSRALRLSPQPCLTLVGAGGKTTALFHLARQLINRGLNTDTVLVAATTHLSVDQLSLADHHLPIPDPDEISHLDKELPAGVLLFTGVETSEKRVSGLSLVALERLRQLADSRQLPLLIEADGSRQKPLKAPAEHEPALPQFADTVVVVAGLSSLGKPLTEDWVHRPQCFGDLAGLTPGELITPEALARVLAHPSGGLKNIPPQARRVALLNQADTPELQAMGHTLASNLVPPYRAAIIVALAEEKVFAVHEPVAGVILAAGGSSRFGQVKQLLDWRGEPLVRRAARTALDAGLSPVVVVSGEATSQIGQALSGLPVNSVHNPEWEAGQSTSVKAGLRALPPETGAAIFLLADQPKVTSSLLRLLVETHAASLAPLVAPQVEGRRGNPVLFDRDIFPDLMALSGDTGGRLLFARYPVDWVPWHDPALLLDIDTPEDYLRLLDMES